MSTLTTLRPLFTIKKDSLYRFLFFSFLFIGYLNTVLRISLESNITLFRVLLPVMIIFSFFIFRSTMIKFCGIVFVFLVYGIFNSLVTSRFENFNVVYFLHYCTLIFLGLLTFSLIRKYGPHVVFNHLRTVYILMLIIAALQFIFQFEIPNTYYRGTLNIYYWVENDLSTALAAFIPFLLAAPNKKTANWILGFLGIAVIVYNSSRIAILSIIFFIVFKALNRFGRTGYIVSAVTVLLLFLVFKDYKLEGNTLYQLLINPFQHIFTLTTYTQYGSIYDRTNALISD
jgi:hypothetical protein